MNVMFFDIDITGHHSEYISHIINYLVKTKTEDNYYFVVNPLFNEKFPEIVNMSLKSNSIKITTVTNDEIKNLDSLNRIKRSKNHFKLMNHYSLINNIQVCYLLHMNVFQIALGLYKVPYKIKGILFMQFTNMRIKSIRDYYYYLRRYLPMLLCIHNKNLEAVYLLNDSDSAKTLNLKFKNKNVFKYLADPIPFLGNQMELDIRNYYNIQNGRKIFLHFGALAERKGTLEILDSISFLDTNNKNIAIILAGKVSDGFKETLIKKINELKSETKVQLILDDDFISNEMMFSLFKQSDVVLIPYKNAEASSGVLGHAIYSYKKVIGPSNGLIGKLINEYSLGVAIDEITPQKLANAYISEDLTNQNFKQYSKFIEEHTPYNFAKTLLCS